MHSSAVSPALSPRNRHVVMAEATIRRFSTHIGLGAPVEPLVCTSTLSEPLFHSSKNSSVVIAVH